MKKYKAEDIAEYFLSIADEESGDLISHLKLQKLVYYAQGVYLALKGEPLFNENIVAWMHGPVVEELYHTYKGSGDGAIEFDEDYELPEFNEDTIEILNEVYSVFGQFSAWKLRQMTHDESPWANADRKEAGAIITHDDMKSYFKTIVKVEE